MPKSSTDAKRPLESYSDEELFFNRELNWLEFNHKVLQEAADRNNPLLERVKFLAIFYNNLNEFFMVRVAGLTRQYKLEVETRSIDGLSPLEQLTAVRRRTRKMLNQAATLWRKVLKPDLRAEGLKILNYANFSSLEKARLEEYFQREIFPVLTPQALDKGRPFPLISGESLNFFIELRGGKDHKTYYVRLKIPDNLPRFICITADGGLLTARALVSAGKTMKIMPMEVLIGQHLSELFLGYEVTAQAIFRIIRNTDIEIEEDEADDLLAAVRDVLDQRRFGEVIKLETLAEAPEHLVGQLVSRFELEPIQSYACPGLLAGAGLMDIAKLDYPVLKYPDFKGRKLKFPKKKKSFFKKLNQGDVFLYHPYDSFNSVLDFIKEAAEDPEVKSIKQTLYRTGSDSSLINSLIRARKAGKQVTAVVELKARFDEMRNIAWARALEEAGINIVYGLVGMKIHAKLSLVVRREAEGLKSYVHIGIGNYNPVTARQYTDFGLLTADQQIGREVVTLFNVMTGLTDVDDYRLLLVSPVSTRQEIIRRIDREIKGQAGPGEGFIAFKLNQLSDPAIIRALYRASGAGVKISLQVRGVCCLRPGVGGLSENIRVTSLVGRFLEHARALYFHNGGQSELFIGSADLMPRNLDRRIEALTPILDPGLKQHILDKMLVHLADNCRAHELRADGSYVRLKPEGERLDSQALMMEKTTGWNNREVET